jgi:DNA-binding transcriptional regulator YiaG
MTELAKALKFFREGKGYSVTKMAKFLGVSRATYVNWEYRNQSPSRAALRLIQLKFV